MMKSFEVSGRNKARTLIQNPICRSEADETAAKDALSKDKYVAVASPSICLVISMISSRANSQLY